MRFNANKFWRVCALFAVIDGCIMMSGCTSAWLGTVSSLLPTILSIVQAIVAFVAGLEGKTVSPATTAAFQKWEQNIASEIANVQSIITAIKAQATNTLITSLQTAMTTIQGEFTSILNGLDVTDTATVSKLNEFLSLGIAAVNAVLAFIPMVISKLNSNPTDKELEHYDRVAASATKSALATVQETYVAIVDEHTVNADVNAVLDTLPRSV